MPESSLSLQLSDFAAEIGSILGFGRLTTSWTGWVAATPYVPDATLPESVLGWIMQEVQSGLRQFYYPKLDGQNTVAHKWSFLSPQRQLTITSGITDYDLPDDTLPFSSDMTYQPSASTCVVVRNIGIGRLMQILQGSYQQTGKPSRFAIVPKPHDGTTGQRFAVKVSPVPDATYVLDYTCNVAPGALTATRPFPYGGMIHGETIMASMRAAAELHKDGEKGVFAQEFAERLQASISADIRDFQPSSLGYVGDGSDRYGGYAGWRDGERCYTGQQVLWNGGDNL